MTQNSIFQVDDVIYKSIDVVNFYVSEVFINVSMFCQYQAENVHSFFNSQFNFDYITIKYKGLEESLILISQ